MIAKAIWNALAFFFAKEKPDASCRGCPDCVASETRYTTKGIPLFGAIMVLWCKNCGALMGLREPFEDWTVDKNSLCRFCAPITVAVLEKITETKPNDTATNHDTIETPALPTE